MKATPELVARIVETAYAGQADGVDLPTAKNDAISAVFGGARSSQAVKVNVVRANNPEGHNQWDNAKHGEVRNAYRAWLKLNRWGEGHYDRPHSQNVKIGMASAKMHRLIKKHNLNPSEVLPMLTSEPDEPAKATDLTLRDALVNATDEELAELEAKLAAAENAPHKNGEVTAVEEAVEQLNNRIKF